jgi:hypothetical protein
VGIQGKRARIGLAEVGFNTLSLRDGSVENNAIVSWDDTFGNAKRLGMFRASEKPQVEVIALAFDAKGIPTVAHVRVPESGATGVIALQTEGKTLSLIPVER